MKQPDKDEFIKVMSKEVEDQTKNRNFSIVELKYFSKEKTISKAVWQMRRKQDIKTREIKKYKARLNIGGSRMTGALTMMIHIRQWNMVHYMINFNSGGSK